MKIKNFLLLAFISLFVIGCQGGEEAATKKATTKKNTIKKAQKNQQGFLFGKVKETMDSGGYTYILLEFEGKDTWVAVPKMTVEVGDEVMLYPGQVMKKFHSKGLNRTFETIIFSQGPVSPPSSSSKGHGQMVQGMKSAHQNVPRIKKVDIKLEPLKGENAITIQEAYKKAKELDGKKVKLKAKVMKISKNILGKNWLHCQDGTGSEKARDFDITVTTKSEPKVGEVVIIEGILHKDKDIGAGYFYPVIIEDAQIKKAN